MSSTTNNSLNKEQDNKNEAGTEPFLVCNKATVKWPQNEPKFNSSDETSSFTLKNVSFSVKSGEMIAITGRVGSGKVVYLDKNLNLFGN